MSKEDHSFRIKFPRDQQENISTRITLEFTNSVVTVYGPDIVILQKNKTQHNHKYVNQTNETANTPKEQNTNKNIVFISQRKRQQCMPSKPRKLKKLRLPIIKRIDDQSTDQIKNIIRSMI